ncbi:transcription antiterminator [Leptotrichia sp. oral taxon 223]|uniref:BglG family transcription antiterminator n=1 Tax=Leptotrichia sp. oral taxon 223 TaxID=712363 RepID=UPI0015B9EE28|nr:PRD domain-containing protein [Leptotrichia sp. oral taxon 223]NWO19670.1 PRD domain-containing protein [Leptotrichia sp. oral taxon 223]
MVKHLSDRQKEILKILLNKKGFISTEKIANDLFLSKKTIYRELKIIENNVKIEKIKSKGIRLDISLVERAELREKILNDRNILEKYSVQERRIKILTYLLKISPKTTSIEKLSKSYYISKTSIVNDLNYIEKKIKKYNLKLEKGKKGSKITGNEREIREALINLINMSTRLREDEKINSDRIDDETLKELTYQFKKEDIYSIEKLLSNVEKKLNYTLADSYYINILTHLLILLERIKNGVIKYDKAEMKNYEVSEQNIYSISKELGEELLKKFDVKLPGEEIYFIYQYLVSSGIGNSKDESDWEVSQLMKQIKLKVKNIIKDIIQYFYEITKIDLRKNSNLYGSLALHIKALINRLEYEIKIQNSMYEEIKKEFPYMYEVTNQIMNRIIEKYKMKKISKYEISYLTIYFQAILESRKIIKNVVIVCSSGFGTSYLLKNRIQKIFPELEVKDVLSVNDLKNNYNLNNVDLIISTIHLKNMNKPVAYVSSVLNEEDVKLLNNNFIIQDYEKNYVEIEKMKEKEIIKEINFKLDKILTKDMIKLNLEFDNKNEIFEELAELLYKNKIIKSKKKFRIEIENRELTGDTNLKNKIAIPHLKSKNILKEQIIIFRLKKEIIWDNSNSRVKVIILIVSRERKIKKEILELKMISKIIESLLEKEVRVIILKKNKEMIYEKLEEIINSEG